MPQHLHRRDSTCVGVGGGTAEVLDAALKEESGGAPRVSGRLLGKVNMEYFL